jgi:hypothetical protein
VPSLLRGAFNVAKRTYGRVAARASARSAGQGLGDAATSPALADARIGVSSHVEQFRDGASYLLPRSKYHTYVKGRSAVGDPSGQFVTTRRAMDRVVREANGDLGVVRKRLGIAEGEWNEQLVRVDIHDPLLHNARLPSGFERGRNDLFMWGATPAAVCQRRSSIRCLPGGSPFHRPGSHRDAQVPT